MSIPGSSTFQSQSSLLPQSPPGPYHHLTSPPFSPFSAVRRKPLPFGSSSVHSSDSTQSPNQSPTHQQSSEIQDSINKDRLIQAPLEHSPPLDQDGFVIRDLDRYGTNQAPWHVPATYSSDVHFLLQISSRRHPEHWAGPLGN
jgi:hypothetical protein